MKRWMVVLGVVVLVAVAGGLAFMAAPRFYFNQRASSAVTGVAPTNTKCEPVAILTKPGVPVYTGSLYDTHIHAPLLVVPPRAMMGALPFAGTMASLDDISVDDIVCLLDKEQSVGAVVFFTIARFIESGTAEVAKLAGEKYPDRIVPFVMPAPLPVLAPEFGPKQVENIFKKGGGKIRGLGELTFYSDYFLERGIEPDDPIWLENYKIANKYGAVVMMHTTQGQEKALATVLAANPEVNFILHSDEVKEVLPELFTKYKNVYYTLDTSVITPVFDDRITGKEQFIADMEENYDDYMAQALSWKRLIERYPDRFLWGTDRTYPWHFDPEVSALLAQFSREFMGRLDPKVQKAYAYQNAEKLFSR